MIDEKIQEVLRVYGESIINITKEHIKADLPDNMLKKELDAILFQGRINVKKIMKEELPKKNKYFPYEAKILDEIHKRLGL